MSKRREQYEQGLERLCRFLEILLEEQKPPDLHEIKAEVDAIPVFRHIPVRIVPHNHPLKPQEGFFFLLGEEYEQYDDVLPAGLNLFILPHSLSPQKQINKFITTVVT